MGPAWKVITKGARWVWKNSWWIVPAGEEVYDRLCEILRKPKKSKPEKDQDLWKKESGS